MVNENLDIINKLINPGDISPSDDDIIRQLSDNLQDITTEDVDAMCDEIESVKKKMEIPQGLKDFRKLWEKTIDINLDDSGKKKILESAKKIPIKIEKEPDGTTIIEIKLGNKKYKILDVNVTTHTDDAYMRDSKRNIIKKAVVSLGGMMGDTVDNRENQKLKEYVKLKEREGFHIPKYGEILDLLKKLGGLSNLEKHEEQASMLMYLTGMLGDYRLDMNNSKEDGRNVLSCNFKGYRGIHMLQHNDPNWGEPSGLICLIACEGGNSGQDITTEKMEPIIENKKFKSIGTIAGMPVIYNEKNRIVEFAGETFDLNPFEGKMSFMSKVGQYADLFRDENVRKVMLTLNI